MPVRAEREFRRAGKPVPAPPQHAGTRWHTKLGLILLTILLLSLSFAPFGQFYLAWVGLVPWLLVVRSHKSQRAAFLWGWLAGILFFTANMWWLARVTGPGMVALMFLLGLFWAVAAVVIRGLELLDVGATLVSPFRKWRRASSQPTAGQNEGDTNVAPTFNVLLLPAIWVAFEWFRGNWPLNGLPWLYLGHTQTPILAMCQVADTFGVYGISFWVVAMNALVALFIVERLKARALLNAGIAVGLMLIAVFAYGLWRMSQTGRLQEGPKVMVVQSNFPQSNTGEKGATAAELVDFHISRTEEALRQNPDVDLVVWSETIMPELNDKARRIFQGMEVGGYEDYGAFLDQTHERLSRLTREHRVALLTGGQFFSAIVEQDKAAPDGERIIRDRRNTAYFFDRAGRRSDDPRDRYDKVHIVPFGEYLPGKDVFPIAYRFFLALSPYDEGYFLTPGSETMLTRFTLWSRDLDPAKHSSGESWRFVTPICFEDIDPALVARMFRSARGKPGQVKEADFVVNVTNDGWFKFNQMPQHLQAARFRSIENRAPTARSVNTGISGFVDSFGRLHGLVPAGTEGASVQRLQLDYRVTLYTRWGDWFAKSCLVITCVVVVASMVLWIRRRRTTVTG